MSSNSQARTKLSAKTKLGYGIGQMGDSIGFNVFYFFFLFFLTDVIGINPAVAGSISLIAVIWDAVTDPIIGHMSDNLRGPRGRRRPFMLGAMIPYGVVMFLMFNNVNMAEGAKNIYYIVISMLFWTFYTAYVIPYFALGAEITNDFDERTNLRVWASYFMYGAVMIASAAPPMIVSVSENAGMSTMQGWRNVGLIFGILTVLVIFICWQATKGKELPAETVDAGAKEGIVKAYLDMFKLKPVRPLVASVLLWSMASSLMSGSLVYLMTHNLDYSASRQSGVMVFLSIVNMVWLPAITRMSEKFDKKKVYVYSMAISGIAMVVFRFIGFPVFVLLLIEIVLFAFGNSTYWTVYYSMMYDISELDEFINGERREGAISALMSFGQKLGAAIAMWLTGQLLELGGYGVAGMEAQASSMVMNIYTLIPGIVGILAAAAAITYPLTRDKFASITAALQKKKVGESYSTEDFKELL